MVFCFYSFGQKVGDKVNVSKKGKYYKATVKQVKGSKWLVHYDGTKSSLDEWVGKDRIKVIKKTDGNKTSDKSNVKTENNTSKNNTSKNNADYKVGEKIMVLKKNFWYSAVILQISNGLYQVHYSGYESSKNDEWVPTTRMKKNGAPSPE